MRHPKRVAAVAVTAALLGLVSASVQHIPPGAVGWRGSHSVTAGWTVHWPFLPLPVSPQEGTISIPSIGLKTREGSTLGFDLELSYGLRRTIAPQLADDVRRVGLDRAVGILAEHVLADAGRRVDTETLLSNAAATEVPLTTALDAAGFRVVRLTFRSVVGDELIRRRNTDAAMRLAKPPVARVLVIGWDGADWHMATPLMASGRMPNLSSFVKEGASAPLRSYDPMFSPLLWTTVATGKAPTEHGIADFMVHDKVSGGRKPITSDFRKVKAAWNILSDFERPSAWIGWWATYPAETSRGLIVTDSLGVVLGRKPPDEAVALPGVVSPTGALQKSPSLLVSPTRVTKAEVDKIIPVTDAEYAAAQRELAQAPDQDHSTEGKSRVDNPASFVMRIIATSRTYQNIAIDQISAGIPVVGVYFEGIDMMGHGFQHYLPPKMSIVSEGAFERFREAVPRFYEFQDSLLGELLDAVGPDTVTLLLSDHGFRTGDERPNFAPSTRGQPEEWHRDWGIIAMRGAGVRRGAMPPASIYDILPTVLYLCGLPLAEDMPGRLIEPGIDPELLRRRPSSRIRSYELVGARFERRRDAETDPVAMQEMIANLRALGYVGGADPQPRTSNEHLETETAPETQYFYHRNLAVQYIRQGRFREAEAELLLANARKLQGKTYEMLSQVRANLGRYSDAAEALEEGWRRVPDLMDPSSVLWMVDLELLAGDSERARAVATEWSPKVSAAVRVALEGRLMDAAGDSAGAERTYRRALDIDPLLVRVAQRVHELDVARGDPYSIEAFLVETLAHHPQVDLYWDLAGQLALARGDQALAVERFRKANSIQPDDGLYLGHLASALAAVGRGDEARSVLGWADRFPPSESSAWMALGAAWDRVGNADRAVAAFSAAKNAGLAGPGADLGSALALARAGRLAEARRRLEDAAREFPSSAAVRELKVRLGN